MLRPPLSTLLLADSLTGSGWFGPLAAVLGLGVIAVLGWLLWSAQRHYALELAEQARLIDEEQEKNRQALKAREAALRDSQEKSAMLATLSREIRAHLNGIIGSADLMLESSLKPPHREHLNTLRASAEALNQSLNDVLDYSSIETGQLQIGHAPFDLRQPLVEVVESLSPLGLLKGLDLVLIVAPDVPVHVAGDAPRLRQILHHLTANAVQFTSIGRVVLRVELPAGASPAATPGATTLRFSVTDTSAGIPPELQATIFERPVVSAATSSRQFGGSGLELAICKRLVELMGGQIGARSLPEGGSEFWVTVALPVVAAPTPATTVAAGLHVVVLDDLAAARVAVSAMLTRLGIDQDATDTVAKAADLLRDAQEAGARDRVLVLDESFARDGGQLVARLLAADPALQSVRLVLLARNPEELPTPAPEFAVAAIVRKPLVRAAVLLEALRATPGAAARLAGSRAPFAVAGETALAAHRGPYVLVVDDDAISRSVSSQLLERLDCIVEVALSGEEAVERARTTPFELIFMDCQMPGLDGFAATRQIRAAAGDKAPPIVALTANISDADRDKCFAAGMCDFVGKPVRKAELDQILQRWVKREAVGK